MGTIAYYLTVPALGAGKATLISSTYVVISALMGVWFLKETFSSAKLLGNAIAFLGLTLLIAMPLRPRFFTVTRFSHQRSPERGLGILPGFFFSRGPAPARLLLGSLLRCIALSLLQSLYLNR